MSKQFQLPRMFNGYKMYFLNKPITYKFNDEAELYQSKFSMKVFLSDRDVDSINLILSQLHSQLKMVDSYMSVKKTRFLDSKLNPIDFNDKLKWFLLVSIRGYKIDDKGVLTPIWCIDDAVLS